VASPRGFEPRYSP